jgi:ASC-1-like (ASCH) protein
MNSNNIVKKKMPMKNKSVNKPTKTTNAKKKVGPQTYDVNVSEPWFSLIKLGLKTIEGRLDRPPFSDMKKGDTITFHNKDLGFDRSHSVKVASRKKYATIEEFLKTETIEKTLPGVDNMEDGVKVYRKFYSPEREREFGILAIRF